MTLVTKLILIAPVAADWQSFVPINQEVWDHIFASDTTWGMKTIKIDHLYEAFWGHGAPPYAGGHPELLVRPTLIPVPAGFSREGSFEAARKQVLGRRAG